MVRSSGPHSKRSLSRSHSPVNNKRVKSSPRDHEKERNRRKSRSRGETHSSRSRDRKSKEERSSESRVQIKSLKSKSLSRSRELVKKQEKKEAKADCKPFDPTNLDKPESMEVPGDDDDWIITDMVQDEEENDNMANENHYSSVDSSVKNNETKRSYKDQEVFEDIRNKNEELPKNKCGHTEKNMKTDYNCRTIEMSNTRHANHSKKIEKFDSKSILDLELEHAKEFHRLRIKHEIERHDLEIKLLQFQINFWKEECVENVMIESRSNPTSKIEFQSEKVDGITELNSEKKQSDNNINKSVVENMLIVRRFDLTPNVGSQTEEVKELSSQNKHSDNNINKNIICNGMETNHIEKVATHVKKSEVN
uniref:Uncharacterized protein n=1 Tax=Clastoptera arizonana TaxID=38151 RepID=A0A1B6EDE5_9HEMI